MHIHLDPVGGVAGDMFAAALLDAFPERADALAAELARSRLHEIVTVRSEPFTDGILRGQRFHTTPASGGGQDHGSGHVHVPHHDHGTHPHPHPETPEEGGGQRVGAAGDHHSHEDGEGHRELPHDHGPPPPPLRGHPGVARRERTRRPGRGAGDGHLHRPRRSGGGGARHFGRRRHVPRGRRLGFHRGRRLRGVAHQLPGTGLLVVRPAPSRGRGRSAPRTACSRSPPRRRRFCCGVIRPATTAWKASGSPRPRPRSFVISSLSSTERGLRAGSRGPDTASGPVGFPE